MKQPEKPEEPERLPTEWKRPPGWCPWEVKIDGVRYPCLHPSTEPHVHTYRGPDGQVHEAEDTCDIFGG